MNNDLYDLIVIGAGPAGIAAVAEAKVAGFNKVLLLEKSSSIAHTIEQYYKAGKRVDHEWKGISLDVKGHFDFEDGNKETTMEYFAKILAESETEVKYNCEVYKAKKAVGIFEVESVCGNFKAKNILVGIGRMGKPNKPAYKLPSSLKKQICFHAHEHPGPENIIVIGGGDSAVEYACHLADTHNVLLSYRKDTLTRPNPKNMAILNEYVETNKLQLKLGVDITNIEDIDGKVKVNFADDTSAVYDRATYALGGSSPVDFLLGSGVKVDEKGIPFFDEATLKTDNGIYVCGDIATKSGGSISLAFNHAYDAIMDIKNSN